MKKVAFIIRRLKATASDAMTVAQCTTKLPNDEKSATGGTKDDRDAKFCICTAISWLPDHQLYFKELTEIKKVSLS